MIDPPDPFEGFPDEDPYAEPLAAVIRDSYAVRGPYNAGGGTNPKWLFEIVSEDGEILADVIGKREKEARESALLMAAAPMLADLMGAILNGDRIEDCRQKMIDAMAEAEGTLCEACEKLGQPSRMTFCPRGRGYHAECVTDTVRAEIAAAEKAEANEPDLPF